MVIVGIADSSATRHKNAGLESPTSMLSENKVTFLRYPLLSNLDVSKAEAIL